MQGTSQSPLDIFIEGWGRMGTHWGVGKVMAEIQALLYLSDGPRSLEEIADRLRLSRSNISLNVRALQDLGVVRKVVLPGDRKDYYTADPNVAKVARHLAAEKKRRELEPALDIVRRALEAAREGGGDSSSDPTEIRRLRELEELMKTIADVFDAFIGEPTADEVVATHENKSA